MHARKIITAVALFLGGCNSVGTATDTRILSTPSIVILGIAQDGGAPQAGRFDDPRWDDSSKVRMIACLGIIDPRNGKRWMIDATPDFRRQLTDLARASIWTRASRSGRHLPDARAHRSLHGADVSWSRINGRKWCVPVWG